jgi:anti-sigma B factor antagonist
MQWGALLMFRMDLGSRRTGDHVVIALHGELDLADAPVVAAALGVVAAHAPRIIVDLAGLEFIDASGVAALSRGRERARDAGGDLLLAAPRRQVRVILAILWTTSGSPLHATVTEAAARPEASAGARPAATPAATAEARAAATAEARAAADVAARHAVVPIRRSAAKMRWQRMAMNAPAQRRRAVTGTWLPPDSWAPCWRPPAVGGISG